MLDLAQLNFQFELATTVRCDQAWSEMKLRHPDAHWLIVIRGGVGDVRVGRRRFPLRRGNALIGLPGDVYELQQDPHKQLVISIVRFKLFNRTGNPTRLPKEFRHCLWNEVRSFRLLEELMLRLTDSVTKTPCRIDGYDRALFRLILWLIREDRHTGENLQQRNIMMESLRPAQKLIRDSVDHEPTTEELARICGLSASTFVRRMRARYGLSPKQFLIQQRMDRAKRLLLSSARTVQSVATELGYKEPGHFTWQFKKWFGVSPSNFRERRR